MKTNIFTTVNIPYYYKYVFFFKYILALCVKVGAWGPLLHGELNGHDDSHAAAEQHRDAA